MTLKKDLRLLGVVSNSLVDEHAGVCEKALQLIQGQPSLIANAAIEHGLRELVQSPEVHRPPARNRQGPACNPRSF